MGKKKDHAALAHKKQALKSALKSEQQLITATTVKRNVFFGQLRQSSADKAAKSSAEEVVSPVVS
jgi:hypothetical protein